MDERGRKLVGIWLLIGVFMIFMQIVIGGVTRLTGSGLSITKWEIVTGTIPPTNQTEWQHEFELYRATPQYAKINEGMSLSEFKFIYFWEYFHRLWARSMGFVFAFPFAFFVYKGYIKGRFAWQLIGLVALAAVVASFGWIMVASGLIDRPYVNAYKLTMHLSLGILLFAYALWLALRQLYPNFQWGLANNGWVKMLIAVLAVQLMLGGLMSGTKAGLFYPTWPDMNGQLIPPVMQDWSNWKLDAFKHYDTNVFAPAVIQFVHRLVAYILSGLVLVFFFRNIKAAYNRPLRKAMYLLPILLLVQVVLGILTVLNSIGTIPVALGVLHQAGGILLLADLLAIHHFRQLRPAY